MGFNLMIIVILVVLSGTYSGLTLALFGIKLTTLERQIKLGDKKARKVYEIRKNGNLLLCSLLLGNVASCTVLAIFLGSLVNGVVAGFITTVLIFVFGEILPQAVFPRFALEIGYRLSWLVTTTRIVFYPVAAPIAWILDRALGEEKPVLWSKAEIGEIIKYHEDVGDGIIDQDEERIILGALSFSELRVADIMIKGDDIFSLDGDILIDGKILDQIRQKGFGKIPVYNNISKQVTGIIYSKNLIGLSDANNKKAKELCTRDHLILINEHMRLDKLLNTFVHRKVYIAIVVDENEELKGLVTFEDIMEEILRMELEEIKH